MTSTAATPVTTGDATVTNPTSAINTTSTTIATALKELKAIFATKPKVAVLSTSPGKTTGKTSGSAENENKKKGTVFELSSLQELDEPDSDSEDEAVTEPVGPPYKVGSGQDNQP